MSGVSHKALKSIFESNTALIKKELFSKLSWKSEDLANAMEVK